MLGESVTLQLAANLSNEAASRPDNLNTGRTIWGDGASETMPPWSVVWTIGAR
jgi:hypothetical protein